MFRKLASRHGALSVCALVCLSLLLLATFCAPIHKHDPSQEASCLFCHATTRSEWLSPRVSAGPIVSISCALIANPGRVVSIEAERTIRVPRAPPVLLLSL